MPCARRRLSKSLMRWTNGWPQFQQILWDQEEALDFEKANQAAMQGDLEANNKLDKSRTEARAKIDQRDRLWTLDHLTPSVQQFSATRKFPNSSSMCESWPRPSNANEGRGGPSLGNRRWDYMQFLSDLAPLKIHTFPFP